jgi:RNA polymerase sigma-70 factor (ECF subfamily)
MSMDSIQRQSEFLRLFLKHHPSIYAFLIARGVRDADADDVLQEVAGVLWGKFETFQPGTNFKAWAFAVARNEMGRLWDRQRRDRRILRLGDEALRDIEAIESDSAEDAAEGRCAALSRCLERLQAESRRLLDLRYAEDLSFEDVARRLDKPAAALRLRVCRIRSWLHRCVTASLAGA